VGLLKATRLEEASDLLRRLRTLAPGPRGP
jgi:hypothetical protein